MHIISIIFLWSKNMDLSTLVLASLMGVLFIMQIITLAAVIRTKRAEQKRPGAEQETTAHSLQGDRDRSRSRRDRNDRQDRRPENKPSVQIQPAPQAGVNSPTDKSLRDINLRLRNAERDQEQARRTLQPPQGGNQGRPDSQNRADQGNRDNRNRNFDRSRDRGRDDRGSRMPRSGNREPGDGRDNWQRDRGRNWQGNNNTARPQNENITPAAPAAPVQNIPPAQIITPVQYNQAVQSIPPAQSSAPEQAVPTVQIVPQVQDIKTVEQVDTSIKNSDVTTTVSQDNLEHGRKITVRRRVLPAENGDQAGTVETADSEHVAETQKTATNITFGRR
jgi:hypothetical protein